jgi:tape measure domain-containing protein
VSEQVGALYYTVTADTRELIGQTRVVERETEKMARAFNVITAAVKVYVAALALVKSAQLADDMRLLAARVQVAAGSIENGAAALGELQRIAARTQTDLATAVGVFNRLNQSILQMGGTQRDTLQITELLGKAIKVSGATGAEAASAMTQFGQALGSGKLAGDELRSLLENAPYLMQQLAKGIGVPVGALKQLGEDGKLTADVVTNALRKAAADIDADFKKLPAALGAAFTGATDQAGRLNEALDTVTGTSAALTGVTRGLGDVIGMLADQLLGTTSEADKLGRSKTIQTWAENTTLALSYVIDAGDFVVRGFRQIGVTIYEAAMSAKAAASGGFTEASERLAGLKQQLLDIGGAQYAGAKIRQRIDALATGTDGSDTLDRRAAGGSGSTLKGGGGPAKPAGGSFDALGYLAKLRTASLDGIAALDAAETEELRKNERLLATRKITAIQAAEARLLIEKDFADKRRDIQLAAGEAYRRYIEESGKQDAAAEKRSAEERLRGQQFARGLLGDADPILRLQQELEAKSALLVQYAALDQDNAELYAAAKVALEEETQRRLADIVARRQTDALAQQSAVLQGYGSLFGSLSDITKQFAGEQSGAYKAMFAVSKAFAIADSIIKIQQGIANALALPYPANIAAAASTAAQAAGLISTIQGTNFGGGRMIGGGVGAGTMVRVNEAGRPEMFTAGNGAQYMLPTADGKVTPAGASGGTVLQVIVENNMPGAQVRASTSDDGRIARIVISELVDGIESNSGPVMGALKRATNVRSTL